MTGSCLVDEEFRKKACSRITVWPWGDEGERQDDAGEWGCWDKEAKEEKASVAILSFFNCLFVSVLNLVLWNVSFRLLKTLGSLKAPVEISTPFNSEQFWAILARFFLSKLSLKFQKVSIMVIDILNCLSDIWNRPIYKKWAWERTAGFSFFLSFFLNKISGSSLRGLPSRWITGNPFSWVFPRD